ncbi:MAG: DNA/RNA nuclease SfsA [Clostridiaceae bacterium]
MNIEGIVKATFLRRPNRFQAYVILNEEEIMVAVPNTGRCREILIEGTTVILREGKNPSRKTKYDLIAAYKDGKLINIDSQAPNKVVEEALKQGKIEKLRRYNNIQREKTFGNSRFDFKLSDEIGNEYYLEVKGVTLEEAGRTMFPDAPTPRGARHLLELIDVIHTGRGAGALFLVQTNDIKSFSPHDAMDKAFGEALRLAKKNKVDVFVYQCDIGEDFLTLSEEVKLIL